MTRPNEEPTHETGKISLKDLKDAWTNLKLNAQTVATSPSTLRGTDLGDSLNALMFELNKVAVVDVTEDTQIVFNAKGTAEQVTNLKNSLEGMTGTKGGKKVLEVVQVGNILRIKRAGS